MDWPDSISIFAVLLVCAVAAVTDVWRFKIYNALTFPALGLALLYHACADGWAGLATSATGFAVIGMVMLLPYDMGGMAAGDVKLMAAIGAWLGLPATWHVLAAACIAAGGYAIAITVISGSWRPTWRRFVALANRPGTAPNRAPGEPIESLAAARRRERIIPFGAMVAFGAVATLL